MKRMKKLVSLLLTLVMVAAMAVSVSADDSYTITINNSTTGHTYEAYQIFDGDLSGNATDGYVLSSITWGSGIDADKTSDLMSALTSLTVEGTTPFSGCSTAADVAAALENAGDDSALAQAFADTVGQYLTTSATATSTYSTDNSNYTISITDPGYYLVKDQDDSLNGDDDAYTRFILQVVADVTAKPKSSTPSVEKKVFEESYTGSAVETSTYGTGYNDVADYDIGDAVPFELIGTMPSTLGDYDTYKYVFHDTLSSGLTFNSGSVVVTIDGTTVASSSYSVITEDLTDGCSFEVSFTDILSAKDGDGNAISVTASSKVVVTYTATLNSNAVIGLSGNTNEVYLEYSNNPNTGGSGDTGKTPEDKVIVFTYELDVTKIDGATANEENPTKLAGAEFVLYKTVGETTYYATVTDNKVTGWTTTKADATTLTSNDNGLFKVAGLDDGTYYLEETKAPTGYNLLASPIKLVIDATTENGQSWSGTASAALTALKITVDDGTAVNGTLDSGVVTATVENNAGSTLPSTGGIGTTIFYVIGTILVLGAAILLVTKKRMSAEK